MKGKNKKRGGGKEMSQSKETDNPLFLTIIALANSLYGKRVILMKFCPYMYNEKGMKSKKEIYGNGWRGGWGGVGRKIRGLFKARQSGSRVIGR